MKISVSFDHSNLPEASCVFFFNEHLLGLEILQYLDNGWVVLNGTTLSKENDQMSLVWGKIPLVTTRMYFIVGCLESWVPPYHWELLDRFILIVFFSHGNGKDSFSFRRLI